VTGYVLLTVLRTPRPNVGSECPDLLLTKGKAIILKSWRGPYSSRSLQLPEFLDNSYMKLVRLSTPHTGRLYPPADTSVTLFSYRLSRTQGHSAAGRNKTMKNPNDSVRNRNRDHPACSAVPEPTVSQRAPDFLYKLLHRKISWSHVKWPVRLPDIRTVILSAS